MAYVGLKQQNCHYENRLDSYAKRETQIESI
jgi:hypothetical protein